MLQELGHTCDKRLRLTCLVYYCTNTVTVKNDAQLNIYATSIISSLDQFHVKKNAQHLLHLLHTVYYRIINSNFVSSSSFLHPIFPILARSSTIYCFHPTKFCVSESLNRDPVPLRVQ
jgi:hypothetical protein